MNRTSSLIISGLILLCLSQIVLAATYNCNSCNDCQNKINSASSGDTVYLTQNITIEESCIDWSNSGVTFDCQGHSIYNPNPWFWYPYGINLSHANSNTIKNCKISRFTGGIYLEFSSHNTISSNTIAATFAIDLQDSSNNNDIVSNTLSRTTLVYGSSYNILSYNTVRTWEHYLGILVASDAPYNTVSHNNVNGGNGTSGQTSIAINSPYNNVFFNTVSDSEQAISVLGSYNNVSFNNVTNSDYGILTSGSGSNIISYNTIFNNKKYGIYILSSNNNEINENIVCYSALKDIYLFSGSGNHGDNNTCDTVKNWNDDGTSGCTYPCIPGKDVTFTYRATDDNFIASCSLWTNISGTWKIDQTDNTITNGGINDFMVNNIPVGSYKWNVECTDNIGQSAFAPQNWTFTVS